MGLFAVDVDETVIMTIESSYSELYFISSTENRIRRLKLSLLNNPRTSTIASVFDSAKEMIIL